MASNSGLTKPEPVIDGDKIDKLDKYSTCYMIVCSPDEAPTEIIIVNYKPEWYINKAPPKGNDVAVFVDERPYKVNGITLAVYNVELQQYEPDQSYVIYKKHTDCVYTCQKIDQNYCTVILLGYTPGQGVCSQFAIFEVGVRGVLTSDGAKNVPLGGQRIGAIVKGYGQYITDEDIDTTTGNVEVTAACPLATAYSKLDNGKSEAKYMSDSLEYGDVSIKVLDQRRRQDLYFYNTRLCNYYYGLLDSPLPELRIVRSRDYVISLWVVTGNTSKYGLI